MAKLFTLVALCAFFTSTLGANPSPDASCGASSSGKYTCAGTSFGGCCSQFGWCGSTDTYCGTGCQAGYGSCTSSGGPSTTLKTSTTKSTTSAKPTGTSLADCLGAANVPVLFASSGGYSAAAEAYNLRLQYRPAAIAQPTTVPQVSSAVKCAAAAKVPVQARSGGHSYASFSTGGRDGALVVDLVGFQSISVDASTHVATVGGGVRLGNLALGLYNNGGRAVPHGTCPNVGIGGHFTHGGFGLDSRAWGLALDSIVAMDAVLANGTAVHTDSTTNPDLFYALRGAGESFAIVTTFYLKTQAAPSSVVNWQFSIPGMFSDSSKSAAVLSHIQAFATNASVVDRKLGLGMYFDGGGFSISGTYFGTVDDFNSKIKPELLRTLPTPTSSSVQSYSWIDSLVKLSGQSSLKVPPSGTGQHDDFFAKSLVVPNTSPLTTTALKAYFDYIISKGPSEGGHWYTIMNLYGGPDSQINVPASSSSAYSDRSALWVFQHYGFTGNTGSPDPSFPSAITSYIQGLNGVIPQAMTSVAFPMYLNYIDPSLTPSQAHTAYYSTSAYSKLSTLKKAWDPNGVYTNPLAIGT